MTAVEEMKEFQVAFSPPPSKHPKLDREYEALLCGGGLQITGSTPDGTYVEIVELPRSEHPYFLGCQFHPEFKSKPLEAHPLFKSFVGAAHANRRGAHKTEARAEHTLQGSR